MPITPYLNGEQVDPEIKRIMGVAFEMTYAALHLTDRANPVVAIVANRSHRACERRRAQP